jgi:tripartite-type tricarboxylate transporter receptor subunit TctC
LAGELFNFMAGTRIVRVPYKSGAQQVFDILNGQVQMQFNTLDGYQDYIKTGRLRAIAVGSSKPSPLLPGVPTLAATLPGFESTVSLGMFAPAKTPTTVIARVNKEVVGFLGTDEARARLLAIAVEPVGSSPDGLASAVVAEINRLGKLIKDVGISAQ